MRLPHGPNPWTVLQTEETFSCAHFLVRSDTVRFGGRPPRRYNSVRLREIGVVVAPIDDEGFITLIGQYRYVVDRFTWELPAGGCKPDQAPLEAAKIELGEETGSSAAHWLRLLDGNVSPGSFNGRLECFVAWGLQKGAPHPEPEEELMHLRVTFAESISLALSGEISHIGSISLLLAMQAKLSRDELPEDLAALLRKSPITRC